MNKIKSSLVLSFVIVIISSTYAIEPTNFRIRFNGTNVTVNEFETRKEIRASRIMEAIAVKKLTGKLEARAVVLGLQIKKLAPEYYADFSGHVFGFINQVSGDFNVEISRKEVQEVGKKHFLRYGEQAYLLLLVQEVKAIDEDESVALVISTFFDNLEYVLDTDTVREYLDSLSSNGSL